MLPTTTARCFATVVLVAMLSTAAQACSGDSGAGASGEGASGRSIEEAAESFYDAYVESYCANVTPCCLEQGRANDPETCRRAFGEARQFFIEYAVYLELRPDPGRVATCLTALDTWFDDCGFGIPEECANPFRVGAPPGSVCESYFDCAADFGIVSCAPDSNRTYRCVQGIYAGIGEPCDDSRPLADGDTGEFAMCDNYLQCVDGVCVARGELGDECSCADLGACCDYDLTCRTTCQPRTPVGGPCGDGLPGCARDAYCAEGTCAPKKYVGEACNDYGYEQCFSLCNGLKCELDRPSGFTHVCAG